VYFDRPCGEHRQSIDQLAHVQEAPNGMEPSRSDWTGIPGIIQYRRISPPDPQVFAGLDLPAIYFAIKS
jgi:hypothetical protein